MSAGSIAARAIPPAVALGLVVALGSRKKLWFKRAHRLATSANIELPVRLVDHVIRFLRCQWVAALIAYLALFPLLSVVLSPNHGPRFWARWLSWVVIALPLVVIVFSFLMSVWPRWRGSGTPRITHSRKLSPSDAFTGTEYGVVVLGWIFSACGGAWALRHFNTPTWTWFAWVGLLGLSVVVWWASVVATMNRPTSASDAVELCWDDMLRFRAVRNLSVMASWGSATIILLADWTASLAGTSLAVLSSQWTVWPLYLIAISSALVAIVFQQGRQLWRRAWA